MLQYDLNILKIRIFKYFFPPFFKFCFLVDLQFSSEPHCKTFDGTKYGFHAECDLVATSSPFFGNGQGLFICIRTTLKNNAYAYISGATLGIGTEYLEFEAVTNPDGTFDLNIFFNGAPVSDTSLPSSISGYPLFKDVMWYRVMLNDFESVSFASPVGMLKVQVDAVLPGASGLLALLPESPV